MKFRKKPIIIEAERFTKKKAFELFSDSKKNIFGLRPSGSYHLKNKTVSEAYIWIETLEGNMRADLGDWIIKGVKKELYPCKHDVFKKSYDAIK